MEAVEMVKLRRKQVRRLFTKVANDFDTLVHDGVPDRDQLKIIYSALEDKSRKLVELDSQVSELIPNIAGVSPEQMEEMLTEEYDNCEAYSIRWFQIKTKYDNLVMAGHGILNEGDNQRPGVVYQNYKLPKLEIKSFDGNIRNWIGFWGQFRKIHDDPNLALEDKFQYLYQATKPNSVAREIVESFPPSGSNYEKAIDVLKSRFAREELLIEVYVRDLLGLVLDRATNSGIVSLANLYDKITAQLLALESLGVTSDKYSAMLFPLVESSLPDETLKAWERYRSNHRLADLVPCNANNSPAPNYLTLILEFLRKEVESEERMVLARGGFGMWKPSGLSQNRRKPTETFIAKPSAISILSTGKPKECMFCKRTSHQSADCDRVQLPREKILEQLKRCEACFKCLRAGHTAKSCKGSLECMACKGRHATVMCKKGDIECHNNIAEQSETQQDIGKEEATLISQWPGKTTYLQTLIVKLTCKGKSRNIRALIDPGSQRSYISTGCALDMGLEEMGEESLYHGLFGGVRTQLVQHKVYKVQLGNLNNGYKINLNLLSQDKICNHIPKFNDVTIIKDLRKRSIVLSDNSNNNNEIEILVGADILPTILTAEVHHISNNLVAIHTKLGWTVTGQLNRTCLENDTLSCMNVSSFDISQLWKLDILGIKDPVEVKKLRELELETIEHFKRTFIQDQEGRYYVKLPWLGGHPKLQDNKSACIKRLRTTTDKLLKRNIFQEYSKVFKEWEELGIIERAEEATENDHYLPHHAVVKESSQTTKIRPVFDASMKDMAGNSLNDCLAKGANLIEQIPPVLLLFRENEIGVTADIAKAFLQIGLREVDRNHLKFLWWEKEPNKRIIVMRHCRVVFGLKSSPFLLAAVVSHILKTAPEEYKDTARKLEKTFYVDNCVTSVRNMNELQRFMTEAKELLKGGQFDLRCWTYTGMSEVGIQPVLGMLWDVQRDVLSCNVELVNSVSMPITKRELLSVSHRVFDPIGFTCPVMLVPKLILQETWNRKLGWDSHLPKELVKRFEVWLNSLPYLKECFIPRRTTTLSNGKKNISLHVLSDASQRAYAGCVSLRQANGELCSVQLVAAKSRIAPKGVTVPRLELLGALIATRLCTFVRETLSFSNIQSYFWTDSAVALAWIKRSDDWSTFVANRCREIRQFSNPDDWHHIPGEKNTADLPSRGCSAKDLLTSGWWERLIGMLKQLLRRNLGISILSYEELYTVLCDCESLLNARPLTYVSEDPDDLIPICPSSFIQPLGSCDVTDLDIVDSSRLVERWRYLQKISEGLRQRFRKEYFGLISSRKGWNHRSLKVGDVVLIGSEDMKRIQWPMGLIIGTLPGSDNVTRLVRLRTADGILLRPVQRLYPLELSSAQDVQTILNCREGNKT